MLKLLQNDIDYEISKRIDKQLKNISKDKNSNTNYK